MSNVIAYLTDNVNIEQYANVVNNCTTSNIYFYVNGNNVIVSHTYHELSESAQIDLLTHFLKNFNFTIKTN